LTPHRSNIPFQLPPTTSTFLQLFHQPKLLTSAELKQRFSPISSSVKKCRHHRIKLQTNRRCNCLVPLERHLNIPVILQKLFNNQEELPGLIDDDDSVVPDPSSSNSRVLSSKTKYPSPIFDSFISNSCKIEQENSFSISETTMKQKFKTLLQKN
jgi:hypothetical protein